MQCDPFGHSPSLPIILTQSGYGCLYIGRSGQDQNLPLIFWWISPVDNSTKVLTYNLGYWEGDFLRDVEDPSSVKDRLLNLVDALEGRTRSTTLLLLVGADFVDFSNTLTQLADRWNGEYLGETGVGLVVGTPEEFFDRVVSHELDKIPSLAVDINPLWQGFYGTRPQGRASERLSEYYLTTFDKYLPILRYLDSDLRGKIEEADELRWLASMNHHHDTITGTSPDSTWLSSEWPRFEEVEDGTRSLFEGVIETITEFAAGNGSYQIVVFNPLSHNRSETVCALVEVPATWNSIGVVDGDENLPTQILSETDNGHTKNVSLAFYARDIPSIGYRTFTLINGTSPPMWNGASISLRGDFVVLNNNVINLTLNLGERGTIDSLTDFRSGHQVLGRGSGEITYYEDLGGAYSMRITRVLNRMSEFRVSRVDVLQSGPLVAAIRLVIVEGDVTFNETYTIYADSPFVDVSLQVKALPDTTLTVELRPSFNASRFINHVPFGVVERPMDENFWPISYWASLEGGDHGVAVFDFGEQGFRAGGGGGENEDILEFMLVRDGSGAVAPEGGFTFSDPDFHDLEYRICPYSSDWKNARVWMSAYDYDFPLVARFTSHGRSTLPPSFSSFSSEGGEIIDLIPLESNPDKFLIITANYDGVLKINSAMALESIYSCFVDGRPIEGIEDLNSTFEVNGVKSLEAYEVVLGKPEFVDAISDGYVIPAFVSPGR